MKNVLGFLWNSGSWKTLPGLYSELRKE